MAKREVAKARGRATAAEEGALAALTEATQCSPLVRPLLTSANTARRPFRLVLQFVW